MKVKILRGIFQGDALLLIIFVIAMIPLSRIIRKCTVGYKLREVQKKINQLMYVDDLNRLVKNEKYLQILIQIREKNIRI